MVTLSVIIPCYNNGEYLKLMLDCFLRQTVDYWEVVVVDDQSTDNTPEIVKSYVCKDQRIKFFQRDREPKGSVVCRNIGFDNSVGKYICHLDADDLVSDTFVEHRVNYMEEHPDIDYASFCAKVFYDGDPLPKYTDNVLTYGVKVNTSDLLEDFLSTNYSFSVWNNIYRRECIQDYPWDERVKIQTDFSFIVPGILRGMKHAFAGLPEVDYYYRYFKKSKKNINMCSNFVSKDKCESTLYLFRNVLEWLKDRSDYNIRKKQFLRFIILQYERLINGGNFNEVNDFIALVASFYPIEITKVLDHTRTKCQNISNDKRRRIYLDYILYKEFRYSIYRVQLTHDLAKYILRK